MQISEVAIQMPYEEALSAITIGDIQDYNLQLDARKDYNDDCQPFTTIVVDLDTIDELKTADNPYLRKVYEEYSNGNWEYAA